MVSIRTTLVAFKIINFKCIDINIYYLLFHMQANTNEAIQIDSQGEAFVDDSQIVNVAGGTSETQRELFQCS